MFTWVSDFLKEPSSFIHEVKQGYYHTNYIVKYNNTFYVVRVPVPTAPEFDLRFLPESHVLNFLESSHFNAPRVLYESTYFSVHSYVAGDILSNLFCAPEKLPDWIVVAIAHQMSTIHQLHSPFSNPLLSLDLLREHLLNLYDQCADIWDLFADLHFPRRSLLIPGDIDWQQQGRSVFAHCDIHRGNVIIVNSQLVPIDWEHAKIAPLEFDLAAAIHKTKLTIGQEKLLLEEYERTTGIQVSDLQSTILIQTFRTLEVIKSAIVDTARSLESLKKGSPRTQYQVSQLVKKLEAADRLWHKSQYSGIPERNFSSVFSALCAFLKI